MQIHPYHDIILAMLRTLKFLIGLFIILALIAGIAGSWIYFLYKDDISEKARVWLSKTISEKTGYSVVIGNINYYPPLTVSFKDIILSSPAPDKTKIAEIKELGVTADIFTLLKERKLSLVIDIKKLISRDILCNASIKTVSEKAATYKELVSSPVPETIYILEANVDAGVVALSDITGNLELPEGAIYGGKLYLKANGSDCSFAFQKLADTEQGYAASFSFEDLDISGDLIKEGDNLYIKNSTLSLPSIELGLNARILEIFKKTTAAEPEPAETTAPAATAAYTSTPLPEAPETGQAETEQPKIERAMLNIPSEIKKLKSYINEHKISGRARADIALTPDKADPWASRARIDLNADEITYDNLRVDTLAMKILLKEKTLSIKDASASLYGGNILAELDADIGAGNIPLVTVFQGRLSGVDINELLKNINGNPQKIHGEINAESRLTCASPALLGETLAKEPAKISPQKIITLLRNNYKGDLSFDLKMTGWENITFDGIAGNMLMENGKLTLPDVKGYIYGGVIELAELDIDIDESNIPLITSFKSRLSQIDIDKVLQKVNGNPKKIHGEINMAARFGCDNPALLRQSLPEGPLKVPPQKIAALLRNNYSGNASFVVLGTGWENVTLSEVAGNIVLEKGAIALPDVKCRAYGGTAEFSSLNIDIDDNNVPAVTSLNGQLSQIDISAFLNDLNGNPKNVRGVMDAKLQILCDKPDELRRTMPKDPAKAKPQEFAMFFSNYSGSASFYIRNAGSEKITFDDISGNMVLKDGVFVIPDMKGRICDGTVEAGIASKLYQESLPYEIFGTIKTLDVGKLAQSMDPKQKKITGTCDSEFSLNGFAANAHTAKGSAKLNVTGANLGPMPLLSPLFGDLYTTLEKIFDPGHTVIIDSASATFNIEDKKITTDDLVFDGKEIYITGQGYMDFDGNLDFLFKNQFKAQDQAQGEGWQNFIKTAIVEFGQEISTARLKGTIKKPKWDFQYTIQNTIVDNITNLFKGISE